MNVLKNFLTKKFAASLLLVMMTAIATPAIVIALTASNGDFEAETVTSGLNKQVYVKSDSAASGGKAVMMLINGTISKATTTPNITNIKVTAKGVQCSGAPLMTVKIDGTAVMSNISVSATSYATYTSPSLTSVKSGSHTVAVSFTNDYYNSSTNCDRNLVVDKVEFTPGTSGDTSAPVAAIANPVSGSTVSGSIPVQATANDNVGVAKVEFYIDADPRLNPSATPYATQTTSPYCMAGDNGTCYGWNTATVADGTHTIVVKAVDTSGNAGFATSTFTVNNSSSTQPPTNNAVISDSSASNGQAVVFHTNGQGAKTTSTPDITGITITAKGDQCSGAPQMVVLIDGNNVYSTSVSSTSYTAYKATFNKIAAGSHSVVIQYTNDYYTSTTCDRNLYVDKVEFTPATSTPVTDTTPPTVSIMYPVGSGSTVSGLVPIQANASDDVGVTSVDFYIVAGSKAADPTTQKPISTQNASPYCLAGAASSTTCKGWDSTTVANGGYTLTAIAHDAAGHSTAVSTLFNVSNSTSTNPGSPGDGTTGTVIKNLDFQTGDLSQWSGVQTYASDRFQVVPAPAPLASKYKYAAQVTIKSGDTVTTSGYVAARSEVYWGGDSNPTLKEGDNYYFGWSTMFDTNFPSPGTSTSTSPYGHSLFIQWKNTGTGSPPADLEAIYNRHQIGYSSTSSNAKCNNWNIPFVRGGRTDWVTHIYFSTDPAKGFIEIWERAPGESTLTKKLSKCYMATLNSGTSSYLKMGYYRKLDETNTGILWHAGMKVGTGFAAVDPTK